MEMICYIEAISNKVDEARNDSEREAPKML
jgi:hypothetical protein